ncbi:MULTISPECIES: hypothetical protein [Bacillus amyloliquefaciens group]|uniref:hypothetical protein n=1 Tax=Bacillus amyloliquefaciens group TaxID=1938374 RepID=UPI00073B7AC6|nr:MULTISPECIES: hypothetical protein [Bacillus amyloliquefaciens group]KTF59788.1 hypothetical protein AR691_13725 [Bacillus amyloliquefaciens]
MGNWRIVNVRGIIEDKDEVAAAIHYLTVNEDTHRSEGLTDNVFFLQFSGASSIAGLNQWVQDTGVIWSDGVVFERGCTLNNLHNELVVLAHKFPSLSMVLNAGGEDGSLDCVKTFFARNGTVIGMSPITSKIKPKENYLSFPGLLEAIRG